VAVEALHLTRATPTARPGLRGCDLLVRAGGCVDRVTKNPAG
jgi:hypothetical protein